MTMSSERTRRVARRRVGTRLRFVAVVAGLLGLITPLVVPSLASAAGNGVMTVSIEPVDYLTGAPQTWAGMTGANVSTRLGYRVSYSCSVEDCTNAQIQLSPGPMDPTYDAYRHLLYQSWTSPFVGATIGGTDATGKLVSLGTLPAGAAGAFTLTYSWSGIGNAGGSTTTNAQYFPNGFPIVMTATGSSPSITSSPVATALPVEWRSTIREPALGFSNPGTRDSGINVSYSATMNSGCLPTRNSAPQGDSRFTCAKSYTVINELDPRATFVSATGGGVYDSVAHTITWTREPAIGRAEPAAGWYAPGSTAIHNPRVVTVRYDPQSFSMSGTDMDYCDFREPVTSVLTMNMVYLGAGGMADNTNVRDLSLTRTHDIVCVSPFAKAVFNSKASTFDGPSRYSNGDSPVVVRPEPDVNSHRWDISVGNQANVAGVAIIEDPNLAIDGTRPRTIRALNGSGVQQNNAIIDWKLNDGTTGRSTTGIATAPAGKWFVGMAVTSGSLAGPNVLATSNAQTMFNVRVEYTVAEDAPLNEVRTNTATAQMTYPDTPGLAAVDLGSRSHNLHYIAPFGRGTLTKASTYTGTSAGDYVITVPETGSPLQHNWTVTARNTGNVPAVAIIEDTDLDTGPSGVRVTSLRQSTSANNAGSGESAKLEYTLSSGATGTSTLPFTAPAGTWITAVRVTTVPIQPVLALETQNNTSSYYNLQLNYEVPAGTPTPDSWTNTASATLTYPGMGIADVDLGSVSNSIHFLPRPIVPDPDPDPSDERPRISAAFVGGGVVEGGGLAVPGRDVTYTVRAASSNVAADEVFSPQYVFIAPVDWMVVPGSAAFAPGSVPVGVEFTYKTITIGGADRQMVIAEWPNGASFGANETWPSMTVNAQPTVTAAPGSSGVAIARAGESTHNWTTTEAVYRLGATDSDDVDGDGITTEGFSTVNASGVRVGAASNITVTKEICFVDPSAADGCEWVAEPGAIVGVDPNATDIEYRVRLLNSGNSSLTELVAYDVLPYLNDMGTSLAASLAPRGSTFEETLNAIVASSGVTLSYSTSTNPCRPEVYPGGPVGCDDNWDSSGSAAAGAKAIRISATTALAPGAEVSLQYKAAVVPGASADAIACNSVAAKATQIGVPAEPLAVCATTEEADLELTVPAHLPLQVGRVGVVPFTVVNNGGSQNSPAIVTIDVPTGVQVASLTPAGWKCESSTGSLTGPLVLECLPTTATGDPRNLAKDVPETIGLHVVPTSDANLCFDGSVDGRMFDIDLANNEASGCFSVVPAGDGIAVGKTDNRTVVEIGDTYSYTITVTNTLVGEELAGIALTDTLPAGVEFVSASDGGAEAGGVVTWPVFSLAQSGVPSQSGGTIGATAASTTRTVTVQVLPSATGSIANTASVVAPDPQLAGAEFTDSATDTDELLKLAVTKKTDAPVAGVLKGDEVLYTVSLSNTGTADYTLAKPATLRDVLSGVLDDASFVSGSASVSIDGGPAASVANPTAGVLAWSGPLATGSTAVLSYRVTVGDGADLSLDNSVFTSSASPCVDGTDPSGFACATTETPYAPTIAKSVQSMTQGDDGRWTIVYSLDVTNLNETAPVTYGLSDALQFGAGITVASAAVTSAPAGVTPVAWAGSGTIVSAASVPAGGRHSYAVTVVADAAAVGGTAAADCITGAAGGFANSVVFSPLGGAVQSATACASPVEPTVTKSVATPTQNADGSWNVVYTVTVTGPSTAPVGGLAYTLGDTLAFPDGVTVNSVSVTGPAGAQVNPGFDGDSSTVLLTSADRVDASATRVFTVTATTSVPAGSVSASDLACAPAGTGGYTNTVQLFSGTSGTVLDSAAACEAIIPQPTPVVTKTVRETSVDAITGDWVIVYDIVVTNPDAGFVTSYDLSDELQFGAEITVVTADIESTDVAVSATWNGDVETIVATDVALPAAAGHTYTVTVVASPATITEANLASMDCRLDSGETGTGFRNVATVISGATESFAVACEAANDPSVVKTTVGAPVQNPTTGVWSVEYEITVSNRSTTTVTGGIPYSLSDAFGFPAGTTVTSVDATGLAGASVNASFDGESDTALATGSIGAAVDELTPARHVFTVTVSFLNTGGLTATERACDTAQGVGGLRNEVTVTVGTRSTGDIACAAAPDTPIAGVAKTIDSQTQNADGTWELVYRVTVANPSPGIATFYDLSDELELGTGITANSAELESYPSGVTPSSPGWTGGTTTTVVENVLLPGGASHVFTFRAIVDAGSVLGSSVAGDCVLASGETGTGFRNSATVATGVAQRTAVACASAVDPSVTKTVNGAPERQADGSWIVSYIVIVQNPSSSLELAYGLSDELAFPAGTVFHEQSVTARTGSPAASATWNGVDDLTVVASGQPLPAGASHVFDVRIRAALPTSQGSLSGGFANAATVLSSTAGAVTSSGTAAADILLPELTISKSSDAAAIVQIGDTVTYTVSIENTGDGDYTTVFPAEVWDDLSGVLDDATLATAIVASANAGTVSMLTDDRVRWSGPLASGGVLTLIYSVEVTAAGDVLLENIAFAPRMPGGTPATPAAAGCIAEDCALTSADLPAFLIEKSASTGVLSRGDSVTYTVTYTNTGEVDLPAGTPATFTDDLSEVLDDAVVTVAPLASTGTITMTGTKLEWSGALASSESVTVTYTVQVNDPATGDGVLTNTAISDPRFGMRYPAAVCPGGVTPCAQPLRETETVSAVRGLAFTKTADRDVVSFGQKVTYTITVENVGKEAYTLADPATITDNLTGVLDDARFADDARASAGTVSYTRPALEWRGALAIGEVVTITYSVDVNSDPTGDQQLVNLVGIGAGLPQGASVACSSVATDNGRELCSVSTTVMKLPRTGVDTVTLAFAVIVVLLGAGGLLMLVSRRPQRRRVS